MTGPNPVTSIDKNAYTLTDSLYRDKKLNPYGQ